MLAELTGNIHIGLAFGGAAIGIGIAAAGGVMAIGRNPGAFGKVFTTMLIGMALAEGLAILAWIVIQVTTFMLETLGIQWPKLIAQFVNFAIVLFVLWRFAYKPVFHLLEARRQKIADGIANAEKIKAELAKTEAARQKILAQAGDLANKLIAEARAAAARVRGSGNAKGHHRRRADPDQGAGSRRAGTRRDARRAEARSRPAGGANLHDRHRQDPHAGGSKPARGGNAETNRLSR